MKDGIKGTALVIGIFLLIALVSVGAWVFRVVTADIKGEGDAIIKQQSAENWTKEQAAFEDLYAEIVATDRKITSAAEAKALATNDSDMRTATDTYIGTKNVCLSFVADYNAKARSFLAEEFRAADLPAQISSTNPTTDCEG